MTNFVERIERAVPWVVPVATAGLIAAPVLGPAELNPAIALMVSACAAAVMLALAAARGPGRANGPVLSALAGAAALVVWLCARSLTAADPLSSFFGTIAQHTGAALYLLALLWTIAAFALGSRVALRRLLVTIALGAGASAVLAIAEALTSGDRGWGSAAGPFENSASLGAFLALGLLSAAGWYRAARSHRERIASALCALLMLGGVAAAESRVAVAGLAAGLAVTAALAHGPAAARARRLLPLAVPSLALGTSIALALLSGAPPGSPLRGLIASLGTGRDAIWRSALAQLEQAPLFGSGPEQFSAWVSWSLEGGLLRYNGTYDPHNAVLAIGTGGGIVGLALFMLATGAAVRALVGAFEASGSPRALAPIIAAPIALGGAALFAWLTPVATLTAAALVGCTLAAAGTNAAPGQDIMPRARTEVPVRAALGALALAALAIAGASLPMLGAEARFARVQQTGSAEELIGLYRAWPDPSIAHTALDRALAEPGRAERVRTLLNVPAGQSSWHVDLALREVFITQEALARDPSQWPRFAAAIERGVQADPASALWPTVAAVQADALGKRQERDAYLRRALALRPASAERSLLEDLTTK